MKAFILGVLLVVGGCAVIAVNRFDERFGVADPARYDHPVPQGHIDYWQQVNPILESRCVVCHACYDAACQMKLSSYEGLARGSSTQKVYNAERLLAATPTRLFEDAQTTAQWRERGFSPVLNERENTAQANIEGSVLAQMLLLKESNPLPHQAVLPDAFDFGLNRAQQCTVIEEFEGFAEDYPLWGMPYGLPGLDAREQSTLLQWVAEGAPYQPFDRVTPGLRRQVESWETFFNGDSLKAQLISRYMFEHLFQAHLYFSDDSSRPVFFELVRSATPPGTAVERIATRVPFDDPGVERVYYRLLPVRESISVKNHMPYLLDEARMQRWKALFHEAGFEVDSLPGYERSEAANPFLTFRDLPEQSRYAFMLDEAQYTIMGFIKGPVCRGEGALNVINDHFWVFFVDPEKRYAGEDSSDVAQVLRGMRLPASGGSTTGLLAWLRFAEQEKNYTETRNAVLSDGARSSALDLDLVWDGEGHNSNAALTVFRHYDSASVVQGLAGAVPQSAWLINYPLLERIHYLLVAGYDVYGNVGHQLNTRVYMDFLRMEGENNFLNLLPHADRVATLQRWYRGRITPLEEYLDQHEDKVSRDTQIDYQGNAPLEALYAMLSLHLQPVLETRYALSQPEFPAEMTDALTAISNLRGEAISRLPETAFLVFEDEASSQRFYFTLLHNSAYTNISHLFGDEDRRLPAEDTVTLAAGFIGAYPNVFMRITVNELDGFAAQLGAMQNEEDYRLLLDRFAVRRSSGQFWHTSDQMHQSYFSAFPTEAGLFDFNRLDNR